MADTIILKDQRFLEHVTMPGHPESPQRLAEIYRTLRGSDLKGTCTEVKPREALREELALNHSADYIESIQRTAGKSFVSLDPDTSTSAGSWQAAILAAGSVLTGIEMIIDGQAANGFALVRPPGHHAERSRAMGFCLFNNVAIGAQYLLKHYGLRRILIVDWDIHHGNGTQNAFYSTPAVLYFSTHQFPYYPGSGLIEETGAGDGKGFTVNVPLPGGQGNDDYLKIFTDILEPIADEYRPEFILVSAGYDIYHLDPLGTMNVSAHGFFLMTRFLKRLADRHSQARILLALEGGYHVDGIAASVKSTIRALTDQEDLPPDNECASSLTSPVDIGAVLHRVKKAHAATWSVFR
jgi:acetoin utilization deacetylase AcuC-like enzyme